MGFGTALLAKRNQRLADKGINQQAPGSASTQVKIKGPSQAEQISAGMKSSKPPMKRMDDNNRVRLGDKDMRSALAEEKLRIVDEFQAAAGGAPLSFEQKVDVLNNGFQQNDAVMQAYANDERIQTILNAGDQGYFDRPEFVSDRFVGEGQFGRVEELAPGYVVKKQAPLVEFGGYKEDSVKGNTIGSVYDYRDVAAEVDQLNYLNKKHITPKVEKFIVDNDGSSEVIMKDLRDNYEGGEEYYERISEKAAEGAQQEAQAMLEAKLFNVKRRQQEAIAASAGVELQDRHEGNVMRHKMTGRPLQIDPSGKYVEGFERDSALANAAVGGMYNAGLSDEAQILQGLLNEAYDKGDAKAFHSLAQQGAASLHKIKRVPTLDEYDPLLAVYM